MEPEWNRLLGSGVRAASVLAHGGETVLHTVIGTQQRNELTDTASLYNFTLNAASNDQTVRFQYVHPLSDPRISPRPDAIRRRSLQVCDEAVLCYGMLDAVVSVKAQTAVYDPQSPQSPEPFNTSGRTAERLAIVANVRELTRLAGVANAAEAGRIVRETERAEVVVSKAGLRGADIHTAAGTFHIPAYFSELAWTIGSGDVFAAAFTEFWVRRAMEPVEAADLASRAVAIYAQYRSVPPLEYDRLHDPVLRAISVRAGQVYLAGPFFTIAQRWLIEEARNAFQRAAFDVKSPLHDVGTMGNASEIAKADLALLARCDRVFALLDGNDVGTIFEIGWARSHGIPVVVFAQRVSEEDLKMLRGTGCLIISDFSTAIATTLTL